MRDGTRGNPCTRGDVLKLIKENGDMARGLDLSLKVFEAGIDLRGLVLNGIILRNTVFLRTSKEALSQKGIEPREGEVWPLKDDIGSLLSYAHFEGAVLSAAHLEEAYLADAHLKEAVSWSAHLKGANLWCAYPKGARLGSAHLEGAALSETHLFPETELQNVDWGNYILGEENMWKGEESIMFDIAADTYRRLKQWYTNAGMYDVAGQFFFRKMTARKKKPKIIFPRKPFHWAWSKFLSLICDYGEKPLRVIWWAALVVSGSAFIYFAIDSAREWRFFGDYLYFSAVSFTTLDYGEWVKMSND